MSKKIFIPWEKAFKAADIDSDSDDESLQDYCAEAAHGFLKEAEIDDEDAEYAVRDAVWDAATSDIFETRLNDIANGIEQIINHVRRGAVEDASVSKKGRMRGITVTVGRPFVAAWEEAAAGTGLYGGETLTMKEVNPSRILQAAAWIPEVYGVRGLESWVESSREPHTPSWSQLQKVAEKAMKKSKR